MVALSQGALPATGRIGATSCAFCHALPLPIGSTVYSRTPIEPGELPDVPNLTCRVVPAANDRVWMFAALPRALRHARPDLVHVQYTIPPACPCPVVTTIHDISFRLFPQWFPIRDRLLLNLTIPAAMRGAARIITDSDSSRDDILRTYRCGSPARWFLFHSACRRSLQTRHKKYSTTLILTP